MLPVRRLRDFGCAAVLLGILCGKAAAQVPPPELVVARSVSGQFIVTGKAGSRLAALPIIITNADFVRLEPALLVISAERIKDALGRELNPERRGLNPLAPPPGKVYLALHPAQSTDETVTIVSRRSADGWEYQVQLPDVLSRTRFIRALAGVLLLQSANHNARDRSAEVPAWMVDGLSQELLATTWQQVILSSPARLVDGQPTTRTVVNTRGLDSLAGSRNVLRDHGALTFAQLSWPTGAQLSGADDGAYWASAQLFVDDLLELQDGPAHLRAMVETLPQFYNWQTAFQSAFREHFPRPLDVEKWWALQVVNFMARDPGPAWTPAVSRARLDEILSVPVEMRTTSNALPAHAEISFQAVIRNFDRSRQVEILRPKLRDLELAQLRLAAAFTALADGYRRALAEYVDPVKRRTPVLHFGKHPPMTSSLTTAADTLKKLDALDVQRRAIETGLKPAAGFP